MRLTVLEEIKKREKEEKENELYRQIEDLENDVNKYVINVIVDETYLELVVKQKEWPYTMVDINGNIISEKYINLTEDNIIDLVKKISTDKDLKDKNIFFKSKFWKIVKKFNKLNIYIQDIPERERVEKEIEWYRYNYLAGKYRKIEKNKK